jgi:hypothetical protein
MEVPGCNIGEKFRGSSGYRKISLSKCIGGKDWSSPVERTCGGEQGSVLQSIFYPPYFIQDFFYFQSTSTVVILDEKQNIYVSIDNGISWNRAFNGFSVIKMEADPLILNRAFFFGSDKNLGVTVDSGKSFIYMNLPVPIHSIIYDIISPISTHPMHDDWLIFTGMGCSGAGCSNGFSSSSYVSWDKGVTWTKFISDAVTCIWGYDKLFKSLYIDSVFCFIYNYDKQQLLFNSGALSLKAPPSEFKTLFEIVSVGIWDDYIVASKMNLILGIPVEGDVIIKFSRNGLDWTTATFPSTVTTRGGFDMLPSQSGDVFIALYQNVYPGEQFVSLMRSDMNFNFIEILSSV